MLYSELHEAQVLYFKLHECVNRQVGPSWRGTAYWSLQTILVDLVLKPHPAGIAGLNVGQRSTPGMLCARVSLESRFHCIADTIVSDF